MSITLGDLPADFRQAVMAQRSTKTRALVTLFHKGLVNAPWDHDPVYVTVPDEVVLPPVQDLSALAMERLQRDLDIKASVRWFMPAKPADIELLHREYGDAGLKGAFVTATPVAGQTFARHPATVFINAALMHSPFGNLKVHAHEALHLWQYQNGGGAKSDADREDMERGAREYARDFMARYFPTVRE